MRLVPLDAFRYFAILADRRSAKKTSGSSSRPCFHFWRVSKNNQLAEIFFASKSTFLTWRRRFWRTMGRVGSNDR